MCFELLVLPFKALGITHLDVEAGVRIDRPVRAHMRRERFHVARAGCADLAQFDVVANQPSLDQAFGLVGLRKHPKSGHQNSVWISFHFLSSIDLEAAVAGSERAAASAWARKDQGENLTQELRGWIAIV